MQRNNRECKDFVFELLIHAIENAGNAKLKLRTVGTITEVNEVTVPRLAALSTTHFGHRYGRTILGAETSYRWLSFAHEAALIHHT